MVSKTHILVTGASGQLGSEIKKITPNHKNYIFFFTNSSQLDITNYTDLERFVEKANIQVIINCAAYTDVDKAETETAKANTVNNLAVSNLAKIARGKNLKLIHISTDYVFDGMTNQPYREQDTTNPQTAYGKTKLAGEVALQEINPKKSIIIRTSWLYSEYGNNFVKTMLRLGKESNQIKIVADQIGSPTFAGDLAKVVLRIIPKIENENVEIYHYSNEGYCSWYDFAMMIFSIKKMEINVTPIKTEEFQTLAKRPIFSAMQKTKIKGTFNIQIPNWQDSLKLFFNAQKKDMFSC